MLSRFSPASGWLLVALGGGLGACDWEALDAIAQPAGPVPAPTAAPDSGAFDGPAPATPSDASDASEAPPVETGAASSACTSSVPPLQEWTFDSTVEGWNLSPDKGVQASLVWNGGTGAPAPGSLEATVVPTPTDAGTLSGVEVIFNTSAPTDLSTRTISAWVFLRTGNAPHLKVMVQTGSQYVWADNGTVYLAPNTWTCLSIDLASPAYTQPGYDPTKVIRLGFEMLSTSRFDLLIDSVSY